MSQWCIVAIPREDDPVWKYSSEKVPHMTLLFLGEQTLGPEALHISQFVSHLAKTNMFPFGMVVDRRGVLGDEGADVLFFEKDRHGKAMINQAREYMLTDPHIWRMYNSTEQYPEWTPHLTMGYPDTPAKKDDRDYAGFSYVEFESIALWIDDYAGPTFRLEGRDFELADLTMADEVSDFLQHYGVEGMKWGKKRDAAINSNARRTRARLDKARKAKNPADRKRLMDEAFANDDYVNSVYLTTGNAFVVALLTGGLGNLATPALREVARNKQTKAKERLLKNEYALDEAKHTEEDVDDFLEHYGVKGMRWGRRNAAQNSDPLEVTYQAQPGRRVKTQGGQNQPASEDAIRVAKLKQQAKASSTDSLSNDQMREVLNRMNMEQQYANLSSQEAIRNQSPAKKFIKALLGDAESLADQQAKNVVNYKIRTELQDANLLPKDKKKGNG